MSYLSKSNQVSSENSIHCNTQKPPIQNQSYLDWRITIITLFTFFGMLFTAAAQDEFITVWDSDLSIINRDQITIPTFVGETYNYTVDWGDGSSDTNVTGDITHTYAVPGTYTVAISGTFPRIYFKSFGDSDDDPKFKILQVQQWGSNAWSSMGSAFEGCTNLVVTAADTPDLSMVTDLNSMFKGCISLRAAPAINDWSTEGVTDMGSMFTDTRQFNQDIGDWNVGSVTQMRSMFRDAIRFNKDISGWNVGNVSDMNGMFRDASNFNQAIGGWDVGNVTEMAGMFNNASSFNQDIGNWDVGNVTRMISMFEFAINFDQDIGRWNVSNVSNMRDMFELARSFDQDISGWNVGNVSDMSSMFKNANNFNQDLGDWDVASVTTMDQMFSGATNFNQDIGNWKVGSVTKMTSMFREAISFNGNISDWDVDAVTEMDDMFREATSFNGNIDRWKTGNVTTMRAMFFDATSFNQDIGSWDVNSVTDMSYMFSGTTNFNQNIGDWNVGNVTNMNYMFARSSNFNQDLGDWDVSNVTRMNKMFDGVALSPVNYDALLNGWAALTLQDGVNFDGGNSQYCNGATARQSIIGTYNWTITDGGEAAVCPDTTSFITVWKTDNVNPADARVTIPTIGSEPYDFTVEWGDGSSDTSVTANITHTYASPGEYTVSISGTFPRIRFDTFGASDKIIDVQQWGSTAWTSMAFAFFNCRYMDISATDTPDLSRAISLSSMFFGCSDLVGTSAFNNWQVGNITDFQSMFLAAVNFNQDLGNWDVGSATAMDEMFIDARSFNQDIGDWDVSQVIEMDRMFAGAVAFNQDIGRWDVGNVTTMFGMFDFAGSFNQDIGGWDVANVTDMEAMFMNAAAFNQGTGTWDVSNVTSMRTMFSGATNFNQNIGSWDVGNVADMSDMFENAANFNQDIGAWDVGNVTITSYMFRDAAAFNQDISPWDVGNVTSMFFMFNRAVNFDQNIGNWDVTNVTDMTGMFRGAGLSTENYDSLLNGWAAQDLRNDVTFDGGSSQYCGGEAARQNIIDTYNWDITDAGLNCSMPEPIIASYVLIDADTDLVIQPLIDGDRIDVTALPSCNLAIEALATGMVESVRLELSGASSKTMTENNAPYSLFANNGPDYFGRLLPVGNYSLTGTPYSENGLGGVAGAPLTIAFQLYEGGLFLVNSDTDVVILRLTDGLRIDKADYPGIPFGVVFDVDISTGNVNFALSGPIVENRTERNAPYSLFANLGGDFFGRDFPVGSYALSAVPDSGAAVTVNFEVMNGHDLKSQNTMSIYPNPADLRAHITFEKPERLLQVQIFDMLGRLVLTHKVETVNDATFGIDVHKLESGNYLVCTLTDAGLKYQQKLIVKR